jgi:tetratricopeptide (TPR) repeat protein
VIAETARGEAQQPLDRARALHTKAVAEGRFGHAAAAIRTLRRALDVLSRLPDDDLERRTLAAEVWLSLAVNEAEVHNAERGLAAIQAAEHLVDQSGDLSLRARLHNNHALIATRAGDLQTASEQFDLAEAFLEHATPHDRTYTLLNSGNVRLYRGQLAEAERLFSRSAEVARQEGIPDGEFRALHNLGYVEFLAGRLPTALASMDAADALDVDVSRGIWALDRARILIEAGLTREADDTLAQAGTIFAADRTAQDLGEVEVSRAECALITGDAAAARRFAAKARDRFRRRGNARWMRTAELVLLQGDLAAGRPGSRLAPVAARLEEELAADGLPVRARIAALVGAEALLSAGRVAEAETVVARLNYQDLVEPITSRLHANYVRAKLDLARNDVAAARHIVREGLAELATYQASFGSIDLRTASAVHGERLAELDLSIALAEGDPAMALEAVERGRAVSSRLAAIEPPADERTAELLAELRGVVESVHAAQSDAVSLGVRRAELERQIRERAWTLAGGGAVHRPADLADVHAALAARDLALVVYAQAAGRLHAVVVEDGRARLIALGSYADVQGLIRRARADFDVLAMDLVPHGVRAAATGSVRRALTALDELLLAPAEVSGRRLVIVPTGLLGTLPWNSLPSRRRMPLVVTPSMTSWLRAVDAPATPAGAAVALAGPGLHRAQVEAQDVAASWPGGSAQLNADRSALATALAEAQVVHVAAHGRHQTENPLFSAIVLADGPLFAHELKRSAPHVVLSACELGVATVRPGDEALGLTSVLLHLGTVSVVSGVSRVGDRVAEQVMSGYHRRLAAGSDSASALAEALSDSDSEIAAPFVNFGSSWTAATEPPR